MPGGFEKLRENGLLGLLLVLMVVAFCFAVGTQSPAVCTVFGALLVVTVIVFLFQKGLISEATIDIFGHKSSAKKHLVPDAGPSPVLQAPPAPGAQAASTPNAPRPAVLANLGEYLWYLQDPELAHVDKVIPATS